MLFVTQASYSQSGVKGLVNKPEDRLAAIQQMVETAGGKIVGLYMTTGEADVLLITEFEDDETAVALGMVAAASGSVSDLKTVRAWTTAEFKSVAEKASGLAGSYRPPGS